jgi:hypothetical protein
VSKRSVILDYASTRSVNRLAASLFDVKQLVEGDTRTFTVFRPRDIRDAFAAEGFRITAVKPQFLLPMALHRFHRSASLGRVLEAPGRVLGLTKLAGSPLLVRADRIA